MIVRGKVIGVNPENSTVTVLAARPSACAHGCENCSSCQRADTQLTLRSRFSCSIGDIVEAEISDKPPLAALAAVYLFPILMLFIVGMVISAVEKLWAISVTILIGMLITYLVLRMINRAFKKRVQGEIINLIKN